MSSKWKLDPKSKPCLLFPSSKIVSSEHGKLLLDESILQGVIASCQRTIPVISETTQVAIVSIVGSQSNEKYLLTKSLIQLYENGQGGSKLGRLEEFTPVLGSGIYLLNQQFVLTPNDKDDVPRLVFILDICMGNAKTTEEQEMLERFLLLASSMVVEIKLENEEHRLLKQLDILNANKTDARWLPPYQNPICDHFLYVFPSENILHDLKSIATPSAQAKLKLKNIIKKSSSDVGMWELENIRKVSIIEMERIKKPLYEGKQCKDINLEKGMVQSLISNLRNISKIELHQKMAKSGTENNFLTFIRSCVQSVNCLSDISSSPASTEEKSASPRHTADVELNQAQHPPSFPRPAIPPRKTSGESSAEGPTNRYLAPAHHRHTVPLAPSSTESDGQGPFKRPASTGMSSKEYATRQMNSTGSTEPGHGRHQRNPAHDKMLTDKRKQFHENYLKAQSYLQTQIPDRTKSWIETKLSPNNIDKMIPAINTYLINIFNEGLLENCLAAIDSQLWTEMEQKVERYCKELSVAYLTEIQTRLKQFTSGLNQFFLANKYFQPSELSDIGQQVYQIVSPGLEGNRLEILNAGCQKIMTYFTSHTEIIKEMSLASKLLTNLITFHNEEMGRILKADIYSPSSLDRIHHSLSDNLCEGLLRMFNFDEEGNYTLKMKLGNLLEAAFDQHVQQNMENLKRATAGISACLEKSKSFYDKEIKDVLQENPNGLDKTLLTTKNNRIIQETLMQLENDIRQTVSKHEPVYGHLMYITNYINDYWKSVEDANNRNLSRRQSNRDNNKGESVALKPNTEQPEKVTPTIVPRTKKLYYPTTTDPDEAQASHVAETHPMNESRPENLQDTGHNQSELLRARQELERLLKEITEQMDTNKKFTSQKDTARKMLKKKVNNFFGVYNNPDSSLHEVQTQIKSLKIRLADLKG